MDAKDQLECWVGQILKVDSDSLEIQKKAESMLIQQSAASQHDYEDMIFQ